MPLDVSAKLFKVNPEVAEPTTDWSCTIGLLRPQFTPSVGNLNSRPLCDYVTDWLTVNQIKNIDAIYHNPYPVGFVCRWIERAEAAEARVRELEDGLLLLAVKATRGG